MITGLKPYPAYKDSGVPWLGEVPEHWEMRRLRTLAKVATGGRDTIDRVEGGEYPFFVRSQTVERIGSWAFDGEAVLTAGDGVGVGKVFHYFKGRFNFHQRVYKISNFHGVTGKFFFHYFRSMLRYEAGLETAKSTVDSLRLPMLQNLQVVVPSALEQLSVVRFLDHADRRIRRHIRAKQKLIKLLEEQKQAIIHRAVTRGLDPNVRLKPSGVEWLGNLPEHWNVRLLGRCLKRIDQGWSPVAAEGELAPDQWAVLTLSSVKGGEFDPAAIKPVSVNARVPSGIEIGNGDLLVTRSNTRELVGDVCITRNVRPRTLICDLIYRLVPDAEAFNSRFLMFQLLSRTGRNQIERDARGSSGTMPKIAQRHIRSWQVIVPPLHEQESIAAAIEEMVTRAQRAVGRTHEEISLLREYRTRLIADVVTGKLDVRAAAAKLPDETEEPEPPNDAETLEEDDEDTENEELDAVPDEAEA